MWISDTEHYRSCMKSRPVALCQRNLSVSLHSILLFIPMSVSCHACEFDYTPVSCVAYVWLHAWEKSNQSYLNVRKLSHAEKIGWRSKRDDRGGDRVTLREVEIQFRLNDVWVNTFMDSYENSGGIALNQPKYHTWRQTQIQITRIWEFFAGAVNRRFVSITVKSRHSNSELWGSWLAMVGV